MTTAPPKPASTRRWNTLKELQDWIAERAGKIWEDAMEEWDALQLKLADVWGNVIPILTPALGVAGAVANALLNSPDDEPVPTPVPAPSASSSVDPNEGTVPTATPTEVRHPEESNIQSVLTKIKGTVETAYGWGWDTFDAFKLWGNTLFDNTTEDPTGEALEEDNVLQSLVTGVTETANAAYNFGWDTFEGIKLWGNTLFDNTTKDPTGEKLDEENNVLQSLVTGVTETANAAYNFGWDTFEGIKLWGNTLFDNTTKDPTGEKLDEENNVLQSLVTGVTETANAAYNFGWGTFGTLKGWSGTLFDNTTEDPTGEALDEENNVLQSLVTGITETGNTAYKWGLDTFDDIKGLGAVHYSITQLKTLRENLTKKTSYKA